MELKETLGVSRNFDPEAGMATAEYAIVTVAAVALAGLLVAAVKSDGVKSLIEKVVLDAFGKAQIS